MNTIVDWDEVALNYPVGGIIQGNVMYHAAFGIFLNIGHPLLLGLVQIVEFVDEGVMTPDLYPAIGKKVSGVVLGYNKDNNQIVLSMKPSRLIL
ncbi:MAG: S1 RNA-binding domain-containing protein [Janthinobacterium lividum]